MKTEKEFIEDKLNNIRRILISTVSKYDIDESIDNYTLVDMVSEIILEIRDIREFINEFQIKF